MRLVSGPAGVESGGILIVVTLVSRVIIKNHDKAPIIQRFLLLRFTP